MNKDRFEKAGPKDLIKFEIGDGSELSAEKRLIAGDIEGKILLETTLDENPLDPMSNIVLTMGGRVFFTNSGKFLFVHTDKSLKYLQESLAV